jgi:hypothetical protein
MPEKKKPGGCGWAGTPGGDDISFVCANIHRSGDSCQVLKIALPYIAFIITSTRYTDRKSRFLDMLLVLSEGGRL